MSQSIAAGHTSPDLSGPLAYRRISCSQLSEGTFTAMCQLAAGSCPGLTARRYLEPRLQRYPLCVLWGSDRDLHAFVLVDLFSDDAGQFVYLGPTFSRQGACVDLVAHLVETVILEHPAATVHVAAECQSPEALMMLSRLFAERSFPVFGESAVPPRFQDAARRFGHRLPHMGPIDPENLSTRSTETLYRPHPRSEPIVAWLLQRGVDVRRGDSQLFLAICQPSAEAPQLVLRDLTSASRSMQAGWSRRHSEGPVLEVANG